MHYFLIFLCHVRLTSHKSSEVRQMVWYKCRAGYRSLRKSSNTGRPWFFPDEVSVFLNNLFVEQCVDRYLVIRSPPQTVGSHQIVSGGLYNYRLNVIPKINFSRECFLQLECKHTSGFELNKSSHDAGNCKRITFYGSDPLCMGFAVSTDCDGWT